MPQLGFHLAFAILAKQRAVLFIRPFQMGFLWGSIFPDMDFAVLIPIYFLNRSLALSFHRSFSHGILIPLAMIIIAAMVLRGEAQSEVKHFVFGFSAGIVLHAVLDVFMWFAPVSVFWPYRFQFNVIGRTEVGDWAWNLVYAAEPLAYAGFLYILSKSAKVEQAAVLRRTIFVLLGMTLILIPLGQFLPRTKFEVLAYSSAIAVGFCPSIYFTIKSWKTLLPKFPVV